jgi:NADH-quinone oxidoreductase subunit N
MALLAVKQNGAQAIMFYSAVYALMDLGAFGTIGLLSAEESDLDELEDYKSLGYSHPWKAALLGLCLLSLAGLPPTAGFIGKFVLFQAALEAGFLWLAVIGILSAIVSIYFYIKVIVLLYMHVGETAIAAPGAGLSGDLACGAVFLLILWLGILPSPLLEIITRIACRIAQCPGDRPQLESIGIPIFDRIDRMDKMKKTQKKKILLILSKKEQRGER